jgi:hypothetical protein
MEKVSKVHGMKPPSVVYFFSILSTGNLTGAIVTFKTDVFAALVIFLFLGIFCTFLTLIEIATYLKSKP